MLEEDVVFVRDRFKDYFARLVSISEKSPPPGKNAANGWWRDNSNSDAMIRDLIQAPSKKLSGQAYKLFECFQYTHGVIQRAFRECPNHYASGWKHSGVFWTNLEVSLGDLIAVVLAIINLAGSEENQETDEDSKRALADSVRRLVEGVEKSGVVWDGAHANGWMGLYLSDAGKWSKKRIPRLSGDGARVSAVLEETFSQMAKLPSDTNKFPWLPAEVQIRYEAILRAATISLNRIS